MKKLISICAALLIVMMTIASAGAIDYGCNVETVGEGIYLEELNTGVVVFEKDADVKMNPASTTKIMTYTIVCDRIADFEATKIEVTQEALATLDPESSVMGLADHVGESYTVKDLLYGLMLPSGNDAALVLATYLGEGNIDNFVKLMNDKATELGCTNTHFVNPHGLYNADHYSTPRDMAIITKNAMKLKDFSEITNTVKYTPEGFDKPIVTTNYMIDKDGHNGDYYYPYAKGIKTGFTDEAGRCLISTAEKDGYTYLCVDLGAAYSFEEDVNYAMLDTAKLYDWAFGNISSQVVFPTTDVVANIDVENTKDNTTLDLVPKEDIKALLPTGYKTELITTKTDVPDSVTAPINQGSVIGTVDVFYDGTKVGSAELCASANIDGATKSEQQAKADSDNLLRFVLIVVFIVATIIIVVIVILVVKKARRKKREVQRHRRRYY